MAQAMIIGRGDNTLSNFPDLTYTGSYSLIDEGNGNWIAKFFTDGTLKFNSIKTDVDLFLVGGGAGDNGGVYPGGRLGGGGGYTMTTIKTPARNVEYPIVIGAGGARKADGGVTSALGSSVLGGKHGIYNGSTPDGGSGGGGYLSAGGSDGNNGKGSQAGQGQGSTTRAFGEPTGDLYSAGGGGGDNALSGAGLTGNNSGAGGNNSNNQTGCSGIVIIRNHRPV